MSYRIVLISSALLCISAAHLKFILLGSLGDLAKKYIWSALHENIQPDLEILGASRNLPDEGRSKLADITDKFNSSDFSSIISYIQLKTDDNFKDFCGRYSSTNLIFYLSIPPVAYIPTSNQIAKFCKVNGNSVRVAYEKPFGYDHKSATTLFDAINSHFTQKEIFLIDHYLGKSITQQIIPLRRSNVDIEAKLNADHVSRIEVTLLETLNCEGRAGYYDGSGVFRDMLQNHITELMTILLADISDDIPSAKAEVLRSMSVPNRHQVITGQYSQYEDHVGKTTKTPTFASVLLTSSLSRWKDTPIILTSGKSQSHDKKEIVVRFKNGDVLKFNFKPPLITWNDEPFPNISLSGNANSYIELVKAVLKSDQTLLPSTETVLQSWKLWDKIIAIKSKLIIHEDKTSVDYRDVGLYLAAHDSTPSDSHQSGLKFFNHAIRVSGTEEFVYQHLVEDLISFIHRKDNDSFHLAVSGGGTIHGVFKHILLRSVEIPWHQLHIWQVDERCDVNFANRDNLQRFLLNFIPLAPSNIHLMPLSADGKNCSSPALYFEELHTIGVLDYIILGVGQDGHTASLFPSSQDIEKTDLVKTVHVPGITSPDRMTLTLRMINSSRHKAIVVTGQQKADILKRIRSSEDVPVQGVTTYDLIWYIEEDLL